MPPDTEPQPQSRPLPIISERTRARILEDLTLDEPFKVAVYEKRRNPPMTALENISESVVDEIAAANPKLVQSLLEGLSRTYTYRDIQPPEIDHYKVDAATKGMAVVLKAYDTETGLRLITNLSRLTDEDIEQTVIPTQQETMIPLGKGKTILERAMMRQRIPEQHVALNEIVNSASTYVHTYPEVFKEGAITMFKILTKVWSKVVPPDQTPPSNFGDNVS
jgi:hypothetical protein